MSIYLYGRRYCRAHMYKYFLHMHSSAVGRRAPALNRPGSTTNMILSRRGGGMGETNLLFMRKLICRTVHTLSTNEKKSCIIYIHKKNMHQNVSWTSAICNKFCACSSPIAEPWSGFRAVSRMTTPPLCCVLRRWGSQQLPCVHRSQVTGSRLACVDRGTAPWIIILPCVDH